jgi:hypothetical protein
LWYLDFLRRVHELLDPPTYLEIGVRHGDSLALARTKSVGVDPAYSIRSELRPDTELFRETSDEYFDRESPLEPFGGAPVALAFIDGMHLLEYALRDFINVERHSQWTSVVVFDDIFPRDPEEASRRRQSRAWTGDVYKMVDVLAAHRRDLIRVSIDTEPTGLLLVMGLDPASTVLNDHYDDILRATVAPDPQHIPTSVVERHGALAPDAVVSASFWSLLRDARGSGLARSRGVRRLRRAVREETGPKVIPRALRRVLPAGA